MYSEFKKTICFNSVDDVESFINDVSRIAGDVDLIMGSRFFDAKSLFILYNLELHKEYAIRTYYSSESELMKITNLLEKYFVN